MGNDTSRQRHRFGSASRLHGRRAFGQVYAARRRKHLGPITVYTKPNDLDRPRLGLSVSRKVGSAVKRNRIKRLLREAFRQSQHNWAHGMDLIVVVRKHEPLPLSGYQRLFSSIIDWTNRRIR